ncbi:MAG TPA: hypothetical protein VGI95_16250 [Caulobacteraceae bacterium]
MSSPSHQGARSWTRRSRGRRASDRGMKLENLLAVGVILAWGWGIYELTLLFLH